MKGVYAILEIPKTSDKIAPDYLHQGRRLTPFTDTTAAAALHVVGQLPY